MPESTFEQIAGGLYSAKGVISLLFASNELGGECGELQNKIKKLVRRRTGMQGGIDDSAEIRRAIADEIADVIICADLLAVELNIDIEESLVRKFNETSAQHGFNAVLETTPRSSGGEILLDLMILGEEYKRCLAGALLVERNDVRQAFAGRFAELADRANAQSVDPFEMSDES